jgi:signal transduction histidine kinase
MSDHLRQPETETEARLRAVIVEQEAKLNELAEIVAAVRHGINNPLAGIIGQLQLLLRSDLSPALRADIESIEQLALRIRDTAALLRAIQRPPDAKDTINWAER